MRKEHRQERIVQALKAAYASGRQAAFFTRSGARRGVSRCATTRPPQLRPPAADDGWHH
jgi:hypothetical protein